MDLLDNVPTWDDVERNLDLKLRQLDHGVKSTWQSAQDGWIGVSRQVSEGASQVYGYVGGYRIDAIRQAMSRSYPLIESDLRRKWASINIDQILPVLLQLVKEVALILGASVAVGTAAGGAAGAFAFGVGAVPGAAAGAGIGLQIGNLILMGLGLKAIAEYFYDGLPACLSTLSSAMSTAWHAGDDFKPAGLDPTGGFAARSQAQIDRAAHQFAQGQEQLVMLLLMAIVTYLTRGQVKAGVVGSVESIAQRSAKLQAQISNKKLAAWLAQNEERLLAHPALSASQPVVLASPKSAARESLSPSSLKASAEKAPVEKPVQATKIEEVAEHKLGKITGTYSAIEPGPLDDRLAETFAGGRYTSVVLEKDTILRRAGVEDQPLGQFFGQEAPSGVLQTRIDKAVLPEWPSGGKSPIDTAFDVKIPAGTEVYIGEVGSQGGFYVGGTEQIVVVKPWTIEGVEVMGASPLK